LRARQRLADARRRRFVGDELGYLRLYFEESVCFRWNQSQSSMVLAGESATSRERMDLIEIIRFLS
jgi:hypothetical protein